MPEKDRLSELEFPLGGLEVAREFQEQTPGTTADTQNCRGINPDSLRNRGGSRAGLAKYVPTVIPADQTLSLVIQHLNVIVDPQAEALRQNFPTPDETWIPDPHNPGFYIPPGGWGHQPNPNADPNPPPAQGDTNFYVQHTGSNVAVGTTPTTLEFSLNSVPTVGSVILVWVATTQLSQGDVDGDLTVSVTVANSAAGAYTQCGTTVVAEGESSGNPGVVTYRRMSLWRRVVASAADQDVVITPSPDTVVDTNISTISVFATAIEYENLNTVTPFQAFSKNSIDTIAASSISTGSAAGDNEDLVVSAIVSGTSQTESPDLLDRTVLLPVFDGTATGSMNITYTLNDPVQAVTVAVAVFNKAP